MKVWGPKHIEEMVACMKKCKVIYDMIAGFDMVNEEDTTPPLKNFLKNLMEAK